MPLALVKKGPDRINGPWPVVLLRTAGAAFAWQVPMICIVPLPLMYAPLPAMFELLPVTVPVTLNTPVPEFHTAHWLDTPVTFPVKLTIPPPTSATAVALEKLLGVQVPLTVMFNVPAPLILTPCELDEPVPPIMLVVAIEHD
jgi:hypothetical protein